MDHRSMHHRGTSAEGRSVSEILAEARGLQARHSPRVLGAVASWIRGRLGPAADVRSASVARRLVVH